MTQNELTRPQWALLHALDVAGLDLTTLPTDLAALNRMGLIELSRDAWSPTEQGHLLIALRRQV